jgi:hypothetical protein
MKTRLIILWTITGLALISGETAVGKTGSVTVTAKMRGNAQANIAKYPWAKKERDAAVKSAQRWLDTPDADLWTLVTPQSLPRTIHTTLIRGTNRVALCPKCREGIVPFGNYPWRKDAVKRPWKLECPNCHEIFPKNDFWGYYLSALDEHGMFQPGKGDPKLLFNTEHPDPKDPLHKYGVDDGYGWYDETGLRWAFVAYYNSWGHWPMIYHALRALAHAYTLTDDPRYAHKAGVLLDRIADVYPEMDTFNYIKNMKFEHSDGSSGFGRIEGAIWETNVATDFALAYDRVYDGLAADPGLVTFLDAQAKKFKLGDKGSFAAIQKHIEDGLLMEIVKGVKDCRIKGNEGMHQNAMAAAAIALDRQPLTNELLDWVFAPGTTTRGSAPGRGVNTGGNIPFIITNVMDRDGMGSEGAPGYSCWGLTMFTLANLLEKYPSYTNHNMFRDFPKYKQCFLTPIRWLCLGQATPPIGDSGACGSWGAVGPNANALLTVFQIYRDPFMARRILELCGGQVDKIPRDIFAENPLASAHEIEKFASDSSTPLQSQNLNGFGLAIMQTPKAEDGRALWTYYGRNTGHGHRNRLDIGLYAKNLDMLPDLGYPEYASGRPADAIWERNSIAHNVVIVDDKPEQSSYTGHLLLFDAEGKARIIEAESPGVFPGATTYRRLTALVDVSDKDSYAVDFFRVRGGSLHRQSWHGPASEAASPELKLVKQAKGTFAGEEIAFGELPQNWSGNPGYMYLYDVQRDRKPPVSFTLDYKAEDRRKRIAPGAEPHLRLTCLTQCAEVALAHGDPPQNKSGNPRNLAYAVLTRAGTNLESLFTTIIEAYDSKPFIAAARDLRIVSGPKDQMVAAVEITLADGRVDTIISCERPAQVEVEGGITLDGTFGIIARRGEQVVFAKLVAGTSLTAKGVNLTSPAPYITGKVVSINSDKPDDNRVGVTLDRPADQSLVGRIAIFENDKAQDAAYTIRAIVKVGDNYQISTGDSTIVRGYANPKDFSAGYVYNVRPGDPVRIPLSAYRE